MTFSRFCSFCLLVCLALCASATAQVKFSGFLGDTSGASVALASPVYYNATVTTADVNTQGGTLACTTYPLISVHIQRGTTSSLWRSSRWPAGPTGMPGR